MGITLSTPYPTGWQSPKGTKGAVKIRSAFAQNPQVGWGQSEDDYPDESTRARGPVASSAPMMAPGFGAPPPQNILQRIQNAPNVQALGGHLNAFWNHPADQPLPQRMLQDVQEAGWEIPTTAYRAGLDLSAVLGSGGKVGSFEEGAMGQGPIGKVIEYGPDIAAMGGGVVDMARAAGKVPGLVKAAGEAIADPRSIPGMAVRGPLGVVMGAAGGGRGKVGKIAEQVAKTDAAQVAPGTEAAKFLEQGAKPAAPRPSRARLTGPQIEKTMSDPLWQQMPEQYRPVLEAGMRDGSITARNFQSKVKALMGMQNGTPPADVGEALDRAAMALKGGDAETANQSVGQAVRPVQAKRNAQVAQALADAGLPADAGAAVEEPEHTAEWWLEHGDEAVVEMLPHVAEDIQDAVLASIASRPKPQSPPGSRAAFVEGAKALPASLKAFGPNTAKMIQGMSGAQKASQGIGALAAGTTSAYGTYTVSQEQKDDVVASLIKAVAVGIPAAGFGAGLGGVATGGPRSQAINRALSLAVRQMLSPNVGGLKVTTDAVGTIASPTIRSLKAMTIRPEGRNILAGMAEDGAHVLVGQIMAIPTGLSKWLHEYNPEQGLATVRDFSQGRGAGVDQVIEGASPGQIATSFIPRTISGVTEFAKHVIAAGHAAANAALQARKERELVRTIPVKDSIAALQSMVRPYLHMDPNAEEIPQDVAEMMTEHGDLWEKMQSGLWEDPAVAQFAHERNVAIKAQEWAQAHLPSPTEEAEKWTLSGDPREGGHFGSVMYQVTGGIQKVEERFGMTNVQLGRILAPFNKIIANAANMYLSWIPMAGDLNELGKHYDLTERTAKTLIGLSLFAGLQGIIGEGANDSGPLDPKERRKWIERGGNVPDAVHILGRWIKMHDVPVELQPMVRAQAALNAMQRDGLNNASAKAKAGLALRDFFQSLADENSYPRLLTYMSSAYSSTSYEEFLSKSGLAKVAGDLASTVVGADLRTAQSAIRANVADTSGPFGYFKSGLPVIGQRLPDKLSMSGKTEPNQQQGAGALLGGYAGRTPPIADEALKPYLDPKYGPGLDVANAKTFGKLPMDEEQQRAVKLHTLGLMSEQTPFMLKDKRFQGYSNEQKKQALDNLQHILRARAFWEIVGPQRDEYLKTLPDDNARSQFKAESLAHELTQKGMTEKYAHASGKPLDKAEQARYDAAIATYQGHKNPPQVYKDAVRLREYAKAAHESAAMASPDYMDYVHHKLLTAMSPEQWQQFQDGSFQLVGHGQYTPQQQVQLYGVKRYYEALPAGDPRKSGLKPKYDRIVAQLHLPKSTTMDIAKEAAVPA